MAEVIKVSLESSDGKIFNIDKDVAIKSQLINNMLEDVEETENESIPLPNVTGEILEKVIEYCQHHRGDNFDEYEYDDEESKDNWDQEYLESFSTKEQLFDTALAANYMDIKTLLNLTCRHIADNIRGKTAEEIRDYFNIPYPEGEGNE
ncbi:E3 ubiquitin ligase SCF complex, Skp subunit [Piromyces finnis]|uniref:E3 ubiquitin ligase complex SCF subunit n=1 Tax=Piromyces finnis TaxID=1754191 RepID=A0A1Y1VDY3_9FUNG|nr:E3 ubiquitin ligase SCF complex, Skp subunit [Piromyces finnis]|eukprot:ORX53816.1 E3 ubiquitin ligase SCF complex, Skp subunit [Piromyces finnis]